MRSPRPGSPELRHRLGPYDALGYCFEVATDDDRVAGWLERLLAGLVDEGSGGVPYRLRTSGSGCVLQWRGERLARTGSAAGALDHLVWHVNRQVMESLDGPVMLHAGAVARAGRAVVVSGPSGAGKSTLTAALVGAGFGYLSDEVAALDPETGRVRPYPKPLGLRPPAEQLLPGHRDWIDVEGGWLVPPARVVREPVPPGLIVLLAREPGADVVVERISPARAVSQLATQTSHFGSRPRLSLSVLADLARSAPAVRLRHDDLDAAVAAVRASLA